MVNACRLGRVHHHAAAIEPKDIKRSASGVRKEIGYILSGRDRRLTGHRPSAKSAKKAGPGPVPRPALPKRDKVVGLLAKIQNLRHGIPLSASAAFGTYLDGNRSVRDVG